MKGVSLHFPKNSMGANMKKGFRNTCNNEASTSTLPSNMAAEDEEEEEKEPPRKSVTLEEMILQLDLEEEKLARRGQRNNQQQQQAIRVGRRMSCVNNSEMILKSARKAALSQYPRFSLDGKDAMYRSSFAPPPLQYKEGRRGRGESVVWCSPGVVARLMGLEVMPVPMRSARRRTTTTRSRSRVRRRSTDLDQMMCVGCSAPPSYSSSSNINTRRINNTAGGCAVTPLQRRPGPRFHLPPNSRPI